jgi:hypothetical protein
MEIMPYISPRDINNTANLKTGIFLCPSLPKPIESIAYGGYGWNWWYMGYRLDEGNMGYTNTAIRRRSLRDVDLPSETICAGDQSDELDNSWEYAFLHPPSRAPTFPGSPVGQRHNKGICLSWADGHASWMNWRSLMTGKNASMDYFYDNSK